ncbi:MAG TPA: T9SS type A sorting domain-containing protein [Bacteroidia bacterium]|nr:T9SS type A sorting domain-containing protein [Bacteroidia bacterium]
MKRNWLPLIIGLVMIQLSCSQHEVRQQNNRSSKNISDGESEARERQQWEWKRLRDPQTGRIPALIRDKELAYVSTLPKATERFSSSSARTNGIWDFRGPWNLGGRTRALAIDVSNENVVLAGGVSGGMWRSTDGGSNWTRVSPVNGYPGVNAVAQDTRTGHEQTWYYLSGEAYGTSASGGSSFYLGNGMYKSTDGGITWSSLVSTSSGTPQTFDNVWDVTWNVATDPGTTAADVVYAAAYDAIFRSSNGGTSWTRIKGAGGTQATSSYFTDVAVSPTSIVYATLSSDGPQKGIWRLAPASSFVNILPVNFPPNYDRLGIGIDPNNENVIYFFGPTPGYGKMSTDFLNDTLWNSLWKYEYVSGNGSGAGGIWTDLSSNLPGNIGVFNGMNTQGGYDVVVKVKPGNPNVVFLGGTNIFRSTSAFSDSLHTDVIGGYAIGAALPFVEEYPNHHPDQHAFAFLPSDPNVMYVGCDGGVSRTTDNSASSVVWQDMNNGYITSQFYTVAVDHGSLNDIVIGGLQDNGTYYTNSTNPLNPWIHSFDGDGSYCQISDGGGNYYFSKQQGKMAKTTVDASGQVTAYRRIDPIGAEDYQFINPFVLDPNNNNLMYLCAGKFIWRNDDLSGIPLNNQWDSITTNWVKFPDSLAGASEGITALAISHNPANRLYYGTDEGNLFRIDNANTGLPGRTDITFASFPANGFISCIAVNPDDADKVLVVFSNYSVYSLFYTTDGGTTWARVAGNLEQNANGTGNGPSLRWASILPVNDGTIFLVGTSTGLFSTDTLINNATVWSQQGPSSIGSAVVDMIETRTLDGLVAVATHGSGLFTTHMTSINDLNTKVVNADKEVALQVFPNPATNVVSVQLPHAVSNSAVKVILLNELGREIRTASVNPENGKLNFPVENLSSGIYYLNLQSDKNVWKAGFIKQ